MYTATVQRRAPVHVEWRSIDDIDKHFLKTHSHRTRRKWCHLWVNIRARVQQSWNRVIKFDGYAFLEAVSWSPAGKE